MCPANEIVNHHTILQQQKNTQHGAVRLVAGLKLDRHRGGWISMHVDPKTPIKEEGKTNEEHEIGRARLVENLN